jgi:hypothetical protein
MKSIRILDKNINLLAEIDNYESFKLARRFYRPGEFEIKINANKIHTDKLIKNNLVLLGKDYNKSGIILHREFVYGEEGEKTDALLIKGILLQGLISRRLIIPNINDDFMSFEGYQETIMKSFVDKNCINPIDVNRKINNLIIADDRERGKYDKWRSSYDNLAEKIQEIGEYCELGWNITLDHKNKKFVFDVIEGKDLTVEQSDNPPVVFRSDFNNVRTRHYTQSVINSRNVVYTGTKEDASKLILSVGDISGFERIETFRDNNSSDPIELKKDGDIALKELEELKSFELEIDPHKTFVYQRDYDLGDKVTVQDRKIGVTMSSKIVEIEEYYSNNGLQIKATFGKSIPTLLTRLRRMVK